jgi:hypothetical protein
VEQNRTALLHSLSAVALLSATSNLVLRMLTLTLLSLQLPAAMLFV